MKKENCPFCGHRWIRKSLESRIECPNCRTEYYVMPRHHGVDEEEVTEEDELIYDEVEE
ncbi:MAG: hypothetical protein JXA00_03245 [Candidatus Thermoplasmatota archaeon]|nr:hypothetical protein [Candidatus Thermoplasmatota archaeon]